VFIRCNAVRTSARGWCHIVMTPHTSLIMLEGSSPELSVAVEAVRKSAGAWCHIVMTPHTSLRMLEGSCPEFSAAVKVT